MNVIPPIDVKIEAYCPACHGWGKLKMWFGQEPHPQCPWCNSTGKVSLEVEAVFSRIDRLLPSICKSTKVFGTGE